MMNTTRNITRKIALMAIAGMALATTSAHAVVTYNQGDLLMGFRQTGGTNSVVLNIGQAALYRDNLTSFSVLPGSNIGTLLTTAFGAGWATDATVFWGVAGSPDPNVAFNGDNADTLYASKEQTTFGTASSPYASITSLPRGSASNLMATMQTGAGVGFNTLTELGGDPNAALWATGASSDWSEYSSIASPFGVFNTAFEATFAAGASSTALDLYRIAGSGAQPRVGTFFIDNAGSVTYQLDASVAAVPEPSRAILLALGLGSLVLRRRRKTINA